MTALRRSELALMHRLDCLATSVQDEVAASRSYWEELRAALATQRASRPPRARMVRRSQCLHHASHISFCMAQACQTQACDPSTGPDRAGMLRGVVSRERRGCFSELAVITAAVARAPGSAPMLRPVAADSTIMQANGRCRVVSLPDSSKCCGGWPRGPGSRPNPHGRGPSALKLCTPSLWGTPPPPIPT